MKTEEKLDVTFYQNLGRLFYAIAFIDNNVREEEIDALKELITSTWLPLHNEPDEYGNDSAFQIEIVFNWLDSEVYEAQECYDMFKEYYKLNTHLFTDTIKQRISKTASAIANAFAGVNKSELIILAQLNLLLNK